MCKAKKISLVLFVFLSGVVFAQTKTIPYLELPTSSGASSGSGLYFSAVMNPTFITLTFEGPSDRWIALGFGTAMYTTDVLIYSNGQTGATHALGWRDYYNTSHNGSGVTSDNSQDWSIVSTNTVSSQRTVTATRFLNTNDPDDIALSYTASALDLVWAKGASADYTIAYHGSSNRANGISLPWLTAPTASFSAVSTTVCAGSTVSFTNHSQGGQTTYNWTFASGSPATSTNTNPTITYSNPGTYSVSLTASNAIGTNTFVQTNYIIVTPTAAPGLTISQITGTNPFCAGSQTTFSATSTNGGNSPSYQWKVNGTNVGTNSSTFSSTSLVNGAVISCVLSSNFTCVNPSTITSSPITMTVNSTAAASISILQDQGSNPLCIGAMAGFTASPGNQGTNPFYQWQINGLNTGSNSTSFTTSSLFNGDIVTCILHSSSSCASSSLVISPAVNMTINPTPVVTVSPTGALALCTGSQMIAIALASTGILWSNGATTSSILINQAGTYGFTQTVNGCSRASDIFTVVSVIQPTAIFNAPEHLICKDSPPISLQGQPAGGSYSGAGVIGTLLYPSLVTDESTVITYLVQEFFEGSPACVDKATTRFYVLDCTGLTENKNRESLVSVYPNPSCSEFSVNSAGQNVIAIRVYDLTGKQVSVKMKLGETKAIVDFKEQKEGIYFLELQLESQLVRSRIYKID